MDGLLSWYLVILNISVTYHSEYIGAVTQFGSAVKLPGSGGAVVGVCLDQQRMVSLTDTAMRSC